MLVKEIFGFKPEDYYVLMWTLPDKTSYWLKDISEVEDLREEYRENHDMYFGVGLAEPEYVEGLKLPQRKRCPQEEIAGIGGLWVDIDVKGKAHKKDNLPPSKEKARELIENIPFEPTAVIDSGNGYQCWWKFNEVWVFDSDSERAEAKNLVKSWIYTIRSIAHNRFGWDVDATIDLSRVMRLDKTLNHKTDPPKSVEIEEAKWNKTFSPIEIKQRTVDLDYVSTPSPDIDNAIDYEVGEIDLNPEAQPPMAKWNALMQVDDKVVRSFNQNRDDLKDQSASAYDMSLANFAVQADWEDQEIVNLLIAHRRNNGCDLKLRQDYYKRTISKAREHSAQAESEEMLEDLAENANKIQEDKNKVNEITDEEVKNNVLKHISNLFGIKIKRFVKYTSDPPQYKLETSKGTTIIGSGKSVLRKSTFRSKIFEATNTVIPNFKREKWDKIIQALGACVEEESLGEEATNKGTAKQWLQDYLSNRPIMSWQDDDREDIIETKNPFNKKGTIYMFGPDFRRWLKTSEMENISAKQMGTILRSYGAEPTKVNVELQGSRTSRSAWRLPEQFDREYRE